MSCFFFLFKEVFGDFYLSDNLWDAQGWLFSLKWVFMWLNVENNEHLIIGIIMMMVLKLIMKMENPNLVNQFWKKGKKKGNVTCE
jgi:uncharacterized membrane protein